MNAAQIVKRNREARTRLRKNVSGVLTEYMLLRNVNHEQLANKLGCNKSQTYRLVSGDRTPEAIMVARIAKLYGTTVERLINGERSA